MQNYKQMKTKNLFPVLFLVFLSGVLFAQNTKPSFLEKKNQFSIDAQPIALGCSYAHKFKPNVILGLRTQVGYGLPVRLVGSYMYVDFGYGNGREKYKTANCAMEVLKFQLFYRRSFLDKFYYETGPVASLVFSEDDFENSFIAGIGVAAYYLWWKINIGIRMEGVMSFTNDFNPDRTYFALKLMPVVIGFNF